MLSIATVVRTNLGWDTLVREPAEWHPKEKPWVYTFRAARGLSSKTYEVIASRPHKWPLRGPSEFTYDLRIGDCVKANSSDCGYKAQGWMHGFAKRHRYKGGNFTLINGLKMYSNKVKEFSTAVDAQQDYTEFKLKDYPYIMWPYELDASYGVDAKYISSFIQGFIQGSPHDTEQIQTTDVTAAEWLQNHMPYAGYVASGDIGDKRVSKATHRVNAPDFHSVFYFTITRGLDHSGFKLMTMAPCEAPPKCLGPEINPNFEREICLAGGMAAFL